MKKIGFFLLMAVLACGCDKFLDTTNYSKKDSGNFPANRDELEQALVGCYNVVHFERDSPLLWGSMMSDECFGNGGVSDRNWQAASRMLRYTNDNEHSRFWGSSYTGVWRCNSIIDLTDQVDGLFTSDADRNNFWGQIYFLRAYFYNGLAMQFGPYVPLRLKAAAENLPAASAEELYAQIGDDLKKAVDLLPPTNIKNRPKSDYGRITRWAAEALLGRVWLFYTGYYNKSSLPTLSGEITKDQVTSYLKDCVSNSGHDLLPKYQENWHYTNDFTNKDYPYSRDLDLHWIGDEGDNVEAVMIDMASLNRNSVMGMVFGIRDNTKEHTYPFRDGWGATSVNTGFFEDWLREEPDDIRRNASIIDVRDPREGLVNYVWFKDEGEETGYWSKKFMDVNGRNEAGVPTNFSLLAYGFTDRQSALAVDRIEIRFADVLLMLSELTGDAQYMNRVRARVGLPAIPYSLEALQLERKHELALEGYRFWDLLRWYPLDQAGSIIDKAKNGVSFWRNGLEMTFTCDFAKRLPATGGFLALPLSEIKLSEGVLKQNPGWETPDAMFNPN